MDEKIQQVQNDEDVIDLGVLLHDFFRGFKKYWWVVAALTIAGAAAMYLYSAVTYTPMYKSEASFTVMTSDSGNAGYDYQFNYNRSTAAQLAATFPYILDSDLLMDMVERDLGVEEINGTVTASAVENSNLFTLSVVSPSPDDASAILQSVIENYPEVSRYVIGDTIFNMISPPSMATEPYNVADAPKKAAMGAAGGFVIGAAFLLVYALTRKTIRKEEEIRNELNAQCTGLVPKVTFKKRSRKVDETLSIFNDMVGDAFKESIRNIALRLQRQMDEKGEKVLMVTSALPDEGVSSIAQNLAYALAEMGNKVILLDANLRRENAVEGRGRRTEGQGLEEFLLGRCPLSEVLIRDHDVHIWRAGCRRGLSTREILGVSNNLRNLISWMKKSVDYVVVDAPDCMHMSDTAVAAENSDAAVFVIKQDYAKVYKIMEGIEDVSRYGMTFTGCILNQTQVGLSGYGYGKYGYGYGKYGYGKYGYGGYGAKSKAPRTDTAGER